LLVFLVPVGYIFSSFDELSKILRDADAYQKKNLTTAVSRYPHVPRKCWNLEFTDDCDRKAHAYIHDVSVINALTNKNNNQLFNSYDSRFYMYGQNTGYNECVWQISVSKTPKIEVDLEKCKIYLFRNSKGMLGIKDYSFSNPRENNFNPMFSNRFYDFENVDEQSSKEPDVIAKVHTKDPNFDVTQRCTLKAI
jgi:hypothetical protein